MYGKIEIKLLNIKWEAFKNQGWQLKSNNINVVPK